MINLVSNTPGTNIPKKSNIDVIKLHIVLFIWDSTKRYVYYVQRYSIIFHIPLKSYVISFKSEFKLSLMVWSDLFPKYKLR